MLSKLSAVDTKACVEKATFNFYNEYVWETLKYISKYKHLGIKIFSKKFTVFFLIDLIRLPFLITVLLKIFKHKTENYCRN